MDFKKDHPHARVRLEEYLKVAPPRHLRRTDAETRARELAREAAPAENGGTPGTKPGGGNKP
jgi:hypothetical protein